MFFSFQLISYVGEGMFRPCEVPLRKSYWFGLFQFVHHHADNRRCHVMRFLFPVTLPLWYLGGPMSSLLPVPKKEDEKKRSEEVPETKP